MKQGIRIGISACLLGERVRFDGGHKRDDFLTQTLGGYFDWISVCPEMEIGLGAPRDTLHLESSLTSEPKLVFVKSRTDISEKMRAYARTKLKYLKDLSLDGFLLKKNSPSCGKERVKLYGKNNSVTRSGVGVFASLLMQTFPNLPVEEEGRLSNPILRENWIERVFAYHRLKALWNSPWKLRDLLSFHTQHKLTLLAHSPQAYQRLGKLLATAKGVDRDTLKERYEKEFMTAMEKPATAGRHANVLEHIIGYFKNNLDTDSRRELATQIKDYQKGIVPLIVPITLIHHHLRTIKIPYLEEQSYLHPHPKELALRNHV